MSTKNDSESYGLSSVWTVSRIPVTRAVEPNGNSSDPRDAEIERLRADVVRMRAEIELLRKAMPSAEEIAYLRRSLPSYGSERNVAVLDRLEAAR